MGTLLNTVPAQYMVVMASDVTIVEGQKAQLPTQALYPIPQASPPDIQMCGTECP